MIALGGRASDPLDEFKELADRLLWRPIETAPKDGTEFLALNFHAAVVGYRVVYFDDEAKEPFIWHVEDAAKGFNHHRDFFTHWMPLPPPPTRIEI